jgi:uncharacterized membrane protein YbaN (DUF454 family)
MNRKILIIIGTISTGLGIIGILVPVLPTTPFLLLAAACYARSSERFHSWLLNNRYLGRYIRDYVQGKGTPPRIKAITIALLWITIGLSVAFVVPNLIVRLILIAIGLGVSTHIILLRTPR